MENGKKIKLTVIMAAVSLVLGAACMLIRFNEDRTPPQITCSDTNRTFRSDLSEEELLEDVSATDDRSGDVSSTLKIEKIYFDAQGNACVVYVAKDASNNIAKYSRIISEKQMVK